MSDFHSLVGGSPWDSKTARSFVQKSVHDPVDRVVWGSVHSSIYDYIDNSVWLSVRNSLHVSVWDSVSNKTKEVTSDE